MPVKAQSLGDQRVSPLALAMLAVFVAAGAALAVNAGPVGPITFVFVLTGWLLSVMLHEFGHALAALKAGDGSVIGNRYLTLDPRRYFKLDVSLILPLVALIIGGIGFPGAAVYLNEGAMRGKVWRSVVSLAGPASTLAVLIALSITVGVLSSGGTTMALGAAVAFLALLQATSLILNLLPIPGFDGYGAIRPFLPESIAGGLRRYEGLISLGAILLLFALPPLARELFAAARGLVNALGISIPDIALGFANFRFWG